MGPTGIDQGRIHFGYREHERGHALPTFRNILYFQKRSFADNWIDLGPPIWYSPFNPPSELFNVVLGTPNDAGTE